ncbi:MAG: hypothetical protein QOI36_1446 [Pseudonocardiales bacterium]|jgi:hypothetical protein|nr:hypothetical protein [Pseudonocardia sp.]MDT7650040.1 hypothetical protein [Pseudonocardiales bacterium]MDT7743803.1 hypothetical protein [Actinomycetota bacterium]
MANNSSFAAIGSGTAPEDPALANTTDRLIVEFRGEVDVAAIGRVVLSCREELRGAPAGALPELIERLARQRLLSTLPTAIPPLP